jgi:tRNA dimethylallyltransferase
MKSKYNLIIITGPTAAGKSKMCIELANKLDGVIINADSMQVYKEIPIISAQPSHEDQIQAPHMLYRYINGSEEYNVYKWLCEIKNIINDIHENSKIPIIIGGTTMYIRLLVDGIVQMPEIDRSILAKYQDIYNEIGHDAFRENISKIVPNISDKTRMIKEASIYEMMGKTSAELAKILPRERFITMKNSLKIILNPDRETVYKNCNNRFVDQINGGAIEEVENLMKYEYSNNSSVMQAIGAKEISSYIKGEITKDKTIEIASQNTRHYAKRQLTWFRNKFEDFNTIATPQDIYKYFL